MVVLVCGNSKDRKKKGKNKSGENEGDFEKIFSHNTKGGLKIGGLKPDNVKIKESISKQCMEMSHMREAKTNSILYFLFLSFCLIYYSISNSTSNYKSN